MLGECNRLGRRDDIPRGDNCALPFRYQTVETTDVQKLETCPPLGCLTLDGKGSGANRRGSLLPTNRVHTALMTHQTSSWERLEQRLGLVGEGQGPHLDQDRMSYKYPWLTIFNLNFTLV